MQVGHQGDGTLVRSWDRRERRATVTSRDSSGRVGPVEGGVDGQQVGKEVSPVVKEVVDPLHTDRTTHVRLDGQGRRVVEEQCVLRGRGHGPVSPHCGCGERRRQDLLRELTHRDLVVVDILSADRPDRPGPGHDGRHQQWRLELRNARGVEAPARNRLEQTGAWPRPHFDRHRPVAERPEQPEAESRPRGTEYGSPRYREL